MKDALILIGVIVGSFALVAWLSTLFQRRFNIKGNFPLARVTKKSRGVAILTAFVFSVMYLVELTFLEKFHSLLLVIAIVALVFSFRKPVDG